MTNEPLDTYIITDHARFELERRSLTEALVATVLRTPDQRSEVRPGREVFQSRLSMGEPPKDYLVRVVVDMDRDPSEVVTAYRTSKIAKYWREER